MPYIAGYLLKLSVSLCVVYLFYILVLRRLTFYNWNRWYLLGYSFLAFLIPFVNISLVLQGSNWKDSELIRLIPVLGQDAQMNFDTVEETRFAYWSWIFGAMSLGAFFMAIRFLVRYVSYQRIRRSAELLVDEEVKIYHVDKAIIPFSFGKNIFVNRELHTENDLQQIIQHEFIHVKQKHTIDILWCELLCMLNWYNPFSWLIRKAMRQNLEFIADQQVIGNGVDKKYYQYLLLKVTGGARFSITQQFNFSSLKKRIVMMNRARSARLQLIRFLFLLPLVSVLLLAFRSNVIERRNEAETKAAVEWIRETVKERVAAVADTVPAKSQLPEWQRDFLKRNPSVKYIGWGSRDRNTEKVTMLLIRRKDGTRESYDLERKEGRELFVQRYGPVPAYPKTLIRDGGAGPVQQWDSTQSILVDATLDGPGNPYEKHLPNVLLVIDGKVQENAGEHFRTLNPDDIVSMDVLKGESAIAEYGEKVKGKEGVIKITTRYAPREVTITGRATYHNKDSVVIQGDAHIAIKGRVEEGDPLYVVEGIEFSAAEFAKMKIEPERIESITILKNESATKLYGEKARKGAIIIKLKKPITSNVEELDNEEIGALIKDSEKLIWHVKGQSFAVTGRGSYARTNHEIDLVVIDGQVYNSAQANRLFKRSEFTGVSYHPSLEEFGVAGPTFQMHRK